MVQLPAWKEPESDSSKRHVQHRCQHQPLHGGVLHNEINEDHGHGIKHSEDSESKIFKVVVEVYMKEENNR